MLHIGILDVFLPTNVLALNQSHVATFETNHYFRLHNEPEARPPYKLTKIVTIKDNFKLFP